MGLTQTGTDGIKDDAITLAKQAAGTDGQIITYDASGNPVAVGPGTDGQVLTSTGAGSPPAFEDIPAKAALTGSTDNTITTVTGANAIQGEANLTFDGTKLTVDSDNNFGNVVISRDGGVGGRRPFGIGISGAADDELRITSSSDTSSANAFTNALVDITAGGKVGIGTTAPSSKLHIESTDSRGHQDLLELKHPNTTTTGDGPAILLNGKYSGSDWDFAKISAANSGSGYGANFKIYVHPADSTQGSNVVEALDITGDGSGANVKVTNGNLVIGTAGHGIDFSATSDASGHTSSLLADYEEGTWTPTVHDGTISTLYATYRKIGKQVTVWAYIYNFSDRSTNDLVRVKSLPYAPTSSIDQLGGSVLGAYCSGSLVHSSYVWSGGQVQFYGTGSGGYEQLRHNELNSTDSAMYFFCTYAVS